MRAHRRFPAITESIVGAALLLLGLTAPAAAAEERTEWTLEFGRVQVPYVRVDRESGRWAVRTIGLRATRPNTDAQGCRLEVFVDDRLVRTFDATAPSTFRFEGGNGVPGFELEVDRVLGKTLQGRLVVAGGGRDPESREVCLGVKRAELRELGAPDLTNPVVVRKSTPQYTEAAIEAKVQGIVLLHFVICPNGRASPQGLEVVRGLGYGLDRSAIVELLDSWRFRPGAIDGRPVPVWAVVEVQFSLR